MASLRKRNNKWQAQVRRTGHAPCTNTFLIRTDAVNWIRQTEVMLDRTALGYDPAALNTTTVCSLLIRYASEVTPHKRGSDSERIRLEVFQRHSWSKLSVAHALPDVFSKYRDRRLKTVSNGTVIRELGLLHAVFETARREWGLPLLQNPIALVRKPKSAQGRDRRLRSGELQALLDAAGQARVSWLKPSILLAVETGMRRGEILNVRKQDFSLSGRLLHIPQTKTDTPRTIPLTALAMDALRALAAATATLEDRVVPVSPVAFKLAWGRCKVRCGTGFPDIADLHFHDLRHEAVSRLFELGLSMPEVAAISGHKDPRMLFRYTHLRPADLVVRLDALAGGVPQ